MRPTVLSLLFLCCITVVVRPQTASENDLESAARNVQNWESRVSGLRNEITSEASAVPSAERSMYLAFLAKTLWERDNRSARATLRQASTYLQGAFEPQSRRESPRSFDFARTAVSIIYELDEDLGLRAIDGIEAGTRDSGTDLALADFFVSMGLVAVNKDTRVAEACALRSLGYGLSPQLPALIVELNLRDPALADALVVRALRIISGRADGDAHLLLYNLHRYVQEFNKGSEFSNASQVSILNSFANALAHAAAIEDLRVQRCEIVFFAPNLLGHIEVMLPARLVEFRQNIQACLPYTSEALRGTTRSSANEDRPKSVDEILEAAQTSHDLEVKVRHYRNAFGILEREKHFERIVSVLDGLPGDDYKKASPTGWANWRIGAAVGGALQAFATGDIPAIYRFIDKTPPAQRPFVRVRLANNEDVKVNETFFLENLERTQKEIEALGFSDRNAARILLELTDHYLTVRPVEALAKFRRAVKHINAVDGDNPDFLPEMDWAPMVDRVELDAELFEIDEAGLQIVLRDISSRRSRVRIKLGLIESSLERLRKAEETLAGLKDVETQG